MVEVLRVARDAGFPDELALRCPSIKELLQRIAERARWLKRNADATWRRDYIIDSRGLIAAIHKG